MGFVLSSRGWTMKSRAGVILTFLLVAAVCFVADVSTKYAVGYWLDHGAREYVVIPGWISIIYRVNEGGIWSIGRDFGATANLSLAVFSSIAVSVIVGMAWFGLKPGDRLMPIVLGAILGGALGNFHDRLVFSGVRDFVDAHYFEVYHYPTFNLADSFLVCGAITLVAISLFWPPADRAEAAAPQTSAPTTT